MARQRKKKPLHNPKAVKLAVPARPAPISRLPDEVLGLIYRHLGPGDRQAMRSTCKAWRESSAIAAQIDTLVFGADSYERHAQYIERIASFPPKSCLRSLSLVMAPKFFETLMKPGEAAAKARRNLETVEELELGLIWGTNHAPGYLDAMAAYGAVACLMPNLRKLATCYKHRDFMCLLPLRQMQHLAMLQVHSCTSDSSKLLEEVSRVSQLKVLFLTFQTAASPAPQLSPLTALKGLAQLGLTGSMTGAHDVLVEGLEAVAVGCTALQRLTLDAVTFCKPPPQEQSEQGQQQRQQRREPQRVLSTLPAAWGQGAWPSLEHVSFFNMAVDDMLALLRVRGGLPAQAFTFGDHVLVPATTTHEQLRAWAHATAALPGLEIDGQHLALCPAAPSVGPSFMQALSPLAPHVRSLAFVHVRGDPVLVAVGAPASSGAGLRVGAGALGALSQALPRLRKLDLNGCVPCRAAAMEAVVLLPQLQVLSLPWPQPGQPADSVTEIARGYAAASAAARARHAAGAPAAGASLAIVLPSPEAVAAVYAQYDVVGPAVRA